MFFDLIKKRNDPCLQGKRMHTPTFMALARLREITRNSKDYKNY